MLVAVSHIRLHVAVEFDESREGELRDALAWVNAQVHDAHPAGTGAADKSETMGGADLSWLVNRVLALVPNFTPHALSY